MSAAWWLSTSRTARISSGGLIRTDEITFGRVSSSPSVIRTAPSALTTCTCGGLWSFGYIRTDRPPSRYSVGTMINSTLGFSKGPASPG